MTREEASEAYAAAEARRVAAMEELHALAWPRPDDTSDVARSACERQARHAEGLCRDIDAAAAEMRWLAEMERLRPREG